MIWKGQTRRDSEFWGKTNRAGNPKFTVSAKHSGSMYLAVILLFSVALSGCVALTGTAPTKATSADSKSNTNTAAKTNTTTGQLTVSPTSLSFGSVNVGSSSTLAVTLSNSSSSTVTISNVSVTGAGFNASGVSAGLVLAAGGSATLNVIFAPATTGSLSGSLSISSDASNTSETVSLSGSGVQAPNTTTGKLTVSPTSLNFGSVNVGSSSTLAVTLSNSSSSSVTISNVTLSGPGFNATGIPTGLILNPGNTATLNVTFSPAATGSLSGSVTLSSDASNSPSSISLSGSGTQSVAHSVSLSWNSSSSPVIGYNIYRSSSSGGPYARLNSSLSTNTAFTDSTVQAGQTYFYAVTSVNSSNTESAFSTPVSAVVPTP